MVWLALAGRREGRDHRAPRGRLLALALVLPALSAHRGRCLAAAALHPGEDDSASWQSVN
jgi:hypothetical protein